VVDGPLEKREVLAWHTVLAVAGVVVEPKSIVVVPPS
jgi:hypothetical protein